MKNKVVRILQALMLVVGGIILIPIGFGLILFIWGIELFENGYVWNDPCKKCKKNGYKYHCGNCSDYSEYEEKEN